MEILSVRTTYTDKSTISKVYVEGEFECCFLEDPVRDGLKVYGETAIPEGRYEIVVTYSNRFKRKLPLLLNVPNYVGVRIHPGNTPGETEGCLLPGTSAGVDSVSGSKVAFDNLFNKINNADEKVFIEITHD